MNKQDMINIMAETADISKLSAETALNAFFDGVAGTLAKGDKVSIIGFGNWEISKRAARKGRNPKTGEMIQIPASIVPRFKAGKKLKDAVKTDK